MATKREYRVIEFNEKGDCHTTEIPGADLLFTSARITRGPEIIYALKDIIDSVLDLAVGEKLSFNSNRDDKNSLAILMRVK